MFYMPSPFNDNHEIMIEGEMASNGRLNIALRSESNNVCQFDVYYPSEGQSEDRIEILPRPDDSESFVATEYFYDNTFSIRFLADGEEIKIFVGENYLAAAPLPYNSLQDIKFISVNGRVKELRFIYP